MAKTREEGITEMDRAGQQTESGGKNFINWGYRGTEEKIVKEERTERSERYSHYIETHPIYQRAKNETLKSQLYFAFLQGASQETIDYFFKTDHPVNSVDMDCYRLLAVLYSLSAVKNLMEIRRPVTLEEIHSFIREQELQHEGYEITEGGKPDGPVPEQEIPKEAGSLTEENRKLLNDLLSAISKNSEVRNDYDKRMAHMTHRIEEIKETYHEKALSYEREIAGLKEHLAKVSADTIRNEEQMRLKLDNERLKTEQDKEQVVNGLKLDIALKEKEIEALNNKVSELLHNMMKKKEGMEHPEEAEHPAGEHESDPGLENFPCIPPRQEGNFISRWKKRKAYRQEIQARDDFIVEVFQSETYPGYQMQFIKQCYQEGMTLAELKRFEKPGIPQENLEILKGILIHLRNNRS